MKLTTLLTRMATILVAAYILRLALDMYESGGSLLISVIIAAASIIALVGIAVDTLTHMYGE